MTRAAAALVPTLSGLVASAILLVDYVRPSPVFCEATGDCARLKQTVYAAWLGLPTPVFGVAGFLLLLLLALQRGPRVRLALAVVASFAALVAALLLSVQWKSGIWCQFCCVADGSALVACAVAWWRQQAGWDPPTARLPRAVAGGVTLAPAAFALVVGANKPVDLPGVIAKELASTPAGQVTVVDFADFECPWCRMTHAALAPILAEHKGQIRVVRKQVPLERIHPHALAAARAACCGESMGHGDAMADALFSAPVDDLTEEGCSKLALTMGLDPETFRKCMQDPGTDARIRADQEAFKQSKARGLPTMWIGEEKIEGAKPEEELEKAITRAIARRS